MSIRAIQSLLNTGKGLIETFRPNSEAERKAAAELTQLFADLASESDRMQMELNKIDAMREGKWAIFRSGWRPFMGWTSAAALIYAGIVYPLLSGWLPIQQIDAQIFASIIMGMLGLGGARTYEKYKGVDRP